MPDVRASRLSHEVLLSAPVAGKVTRQGVQVALSQPGASSTTARVQRFSTEVLAAYPARSKVTRQGVQAALSVPAATSVDARVARFSAEVLAVAAPKAGVTRQGIQVAMARPGADITLTARVQRFSLETLARSFIPMTTFSLPVGWELFLHNWAKSSSIESAWNTDISSSDTLAEERTALMQKPFRSLSVSWTVKGKEEVNSLLVEMRRLMLETSVAPVYADAVEVTTDAASGQAVVRGDFSTGRFFKGGPVVIAQFKRTNDGTQSTRLDFFEDAVIGARFDDRIVLTGNLSATFKSGQCIAMPLMKVHPQTELNIVHLNEHMMTLEAEFDEIYGDTALPPMVSEVPPNFDVYNDIPVLSTVPDWGRGIRSGMRREGSQDSLGRGRVVYQRGDRHRVMHRLEFREDRVGGWDLIRFFESRRGRLLPFWVVDFENIYTVALISNPFVTISSTVGTLAQFQAEMDHIGLIFSDGTSVVRRTTAVVDNGGAWRITVADSLPGAYTHQDVVGFGRARLCRMEEDALLEEWTVTNLCSLSIPVIELLDETEVTS